MDGFDLHEVAGLGDGDGGASLDERAGYKEEEGDRVSKVHSLYCFGVQVGVSSQGT